MEYPVCDGWDDLLVYLRLRHVLKVLKRPAPHPVDQEVGDLSKFAFPANRLYVTNSSLSNLKTGSWLHHRSRLCVGEGIILGSGAIALIAGNGPRSSPGSPK